MIAAAAKAKKTLMFNFNNRTRPEAYAIREYIERGDVGAINSAQAKWQRRSGIPGFGGWFTTKVLSGGDPVIDLLHMFDFAFYFIEGKEAPLNTPPQAVVLMKIIDTIYTSAKPGSP
jgi:predicted dehydrogenase